MLLVSRSEVGKPWRPCALRIKDMILRDGFAFEVAIGDSGSRVAAAMGRRPIAIRS